MPKDNLVENLSAVVLIGIVGLLLLAVVAFYGGIVWVVIHFIAKFW